MREVVYDSDGYLVTHYPTGSDRVIVAFASAGRWGPGEPFEEFRHTLSRFAVSMIFVMDKHSRWYNNGDTERLFAVIASLISKYDNAGTVGESMGGSGALLFTNYSNVVSRALSFVPQFSVSHPYIAFDARYAGLEDAFPENWFWDFDMSPIKPNCVLLYGNTEPLDRVHAAMFNASGFNVLHVNDAGHNVAEYLKKNYSKNYLSSLLEVFCDFNTEFSSNSTKEALNGVLSELSIRPGFRLRDEKVWSRNHRNFILTGAGSELLNAPSLHLTNIARDKRTDQSSISQWSLQETTEADSAGAVNGVLTGEYGFHTGDDVIPWWMVDFEDCYSISEIRLFNRITNYPVAQRAARFKIEVGATKSQFETIFSKTDDLPFGGADGLPFVLTLSEPVSARYLRISLLKRTFLHLDQVAVFGTLVQSQKGA